MGQVFYADPNSAFEFKNGAIGYRNGLPFDCLGPYAKVKNCPIQGTDIRLTCYASSHADTFFSVPANTRYRGKHIKGFFTIEDGNIFFVPMKEYDQFFGIK